MTNEEILVKCFSIDLPQSKQVLKAMQEAREDEAIKFIDWIENTFWVLTNIDNKWSNYGDLGTHYHGITVNSTKELYQLFKQETTKLT